MTDNPPFDKPTKSRHLDSTLSPVIEESDGPRTRRLKRSESQLSDSVTFVTDLGLSVASSPFYDSSINIWGIKDLPDRVSIVRRAQPLSIDNFRKQLFAKLLRSAIDKSEYLPINAFEQLFNMDSVVGLIKANFPEAGPKFQVDKINDVIGVESKEPRRRLYGILVAMGRTSHMQMFVQERLCDDDLPLRQSTSDTRHFTTQSQRDTAEPPQTNSVKATENTTLFREWERNDIYLFYTYQQMFFVPFFQFRHINLCYYPLDHNVTLPWQEYEHKTNGGEGIVHKVQIHPSHHNYEGSLVRSRQYYLERF